MGGKRERSPVDIYGEFAMPTERSRVGATEPKLTRHLVLSGFRRSNQYGIFGDPGRTTRVRVRREQRVPLEFLVM